MSVVPVLPSNPSIGVEFDQAITFDAAYGKPRLRLVTFAVTTSAAVANRFVKLHINDGSGNTMYLSENNVAQVAGVTCQYTFALGLGPSGTAPSTNAASRVFALPDIIWVSGWHIGTTTTALDSADQIYNFVYQNEDREGC